AMVDSGVRHPRDFLAANGLVGAGCEGGSSEVFRVNGGPPIHADGTLVKEPGIPAVYLIQNGQRRLITDENRLSNLYSNGRFCFGDCITVSSDELHSVYSPVPPVTSPLPSNGKPEPTGRLIKPLGGSANPSEIAIVTATGGRRVFFPYSAFVSLGYVYCNV